MQPDTFFKQLYTKDAILRRLGEGDALALARYRQQPFVAEQGNFPLPFSEHDAQHLVHSQRGVHPNASGQEFLGVMVAGPASAPTAGPSIIGEWSLLTDHIDHRQIELGLSFSAGVFHEALVYPVLYILLEYLLEGLGKNKVRLTLRAGQESLGQMLAAYGLRCEGYLRDNAFYRGRWWDEYPYAILRRQWRSRSRDAHATGSQLQPHS